MTYGSVPMMPSQRNPPRLSQVPGVEVPGVEFMATVFDLKPGETAIAMNHPQTIAYVVQPRKFEFRTRGGDDVTSKSVIWEQFTTDRYAITPPCPTRSNADVPCLGKGVARVGRFRVGSQADKSAAAVTGGCCRHEKGIRRERSSRKPYLSFRSVASRLMFCQS